MPDSAEILEHLARLSHSYIWLAVLWHLAIFALMIRKGWRPKQRHAAQILLLPLLSVSILALIHGNPFNGLMFLILTFILGIISLRLTHQPVSFHRKWTFPLGVCAVLYALVYPHFLPDRSPWLAFIAAPVGIIPCPTLSLVLGFTLLMGGFHSRLWQAVCSMAGGFYALFGILVLGVWLDLGLLLVSVSLLILMLDQKLLSWNPHTSSPSYHAPRK